MKIGIVRYPYFKQLLKGGDHVLFDFIVEALEPDHSVSMIEFRRPFRGLVTRLPERAGKILMQLVDLLIPFLYAWQMRSILTKFDVVIGDSSAITRIPFCGIASSKMIVLINIDYYAYLSAVGSSLPFHRRAIMYWKSWMQDRALNAYQSVAVSHFVAETVAARVSHIPEVVENCIQFGPKEMSSNQSNRGMVYAGSGDYFGKGLDVLEALGSRGMAIHTYSPATLAGCINHGPVQRDVLLSVLSSYDVMIFPSRYESFGLVAIEAMASGLPVVMRPTGIGIELAKVIPWCVVSADPSIHEWESAVRHILANHSQIVEVCRKFASNYVDRSTFVSCWQKKIALFGGSPH